MVKFYLAIKKWLPFQNAAKSGVPPIFKMVPLVCRIHVPSVLLLSKSAQFPHLSAPIRWTIWSNMIWLCSMWYDTDPDCTQR